MKKQCAKCSAELDADVKFCPDCGSADFKDIPAEQEEKPSTNPAADTFPQGMPVYNPTSADI